MYFKWYFLIIAFIPVFLLFSPQPFREVSAVQIDFIGLFYILFVQLPVLFNLPKFNLPIVNHLINVGVYIVVFFILYFRGYNKVEQTN